MFNSTHIFMPDEHHNTKAIIGADLHDIMVRLPLECSGFWTLVYIVI